MELPQIILVAIAIAAACGGTAAYFSRSRGSETIKLLETNVTAYKDSEKLKDARIFYLEGQLVVKDETIKRLLNDGSQSKKSRR